MSETESLLDDEYIHNDVDLNMYDEYIRLFEVEWNDEEDVD